ncbi:hybrid sensor histidine kinase/response regulator [Erythrobacter sp. SAORIC-644]|uniref:hybrid sensor histidine kinase/response regulator n=1 Tax=Erythrobacter sp. SAORIC-644 TaxID=1869314 RepID=UPI000C9FA1A0|nr:PAS domain-containing sensor histidine kinase [Erythrobacter sp. SAORIC-644]MEC7952943.1 response regulator [Pseudomonadota bacterium]PNQ76809.1 hybrid sensor histidine kinase/response regulator [Erythrobacter sp. SAORIC-644]
MKVQDDNPITRLPPAPLMLGVVAACIVSIGLVWLVGQQSVVALAYGGALIAILLMLLLAARLKTDPAETQMLQPDWSVTSAAIETRHRAIAIVDRANRLVCANSTYEGWFDGISAPYELAMDPASREAASEAARSAWRDGRAEVPVVRLSSGDMEYRLRIERSGRGEAYLVWRFDEIRTQRSYDGLSERLAGPLGEVLSRAGVEVALVAPDGIVQTTTPGLAERATGHRENAVGGLEFVQLLRSDDRDRIFFAREGQQGSPQTLIHVPLDIPNASKMSDADETPSIMLLLDSTVGIGGGWESTGKAAIPQLEALLSALPLGLALTDRDGRFLFANKAFLRAVERETSGLPQFPSDLVVREDKAAMADTVRRFAKGATASGDMAVRLGNNKDEPVSIGLAGVRGLGDAAVLLSISDSSEEKRLRRQVAQATKMQAVGQLAGGVAHDFNNVLTAIIGYCDLMLLRHTPGDSDYDDIQQIKANSNRAASLTRQLLAFSRQQTLRPVVLQLPDVVSEVSQLLKRLMGEKIEFSVRHDRELGSVRADPQQLEQVIINLAVNARDAMQAYASKRGKQDWKGRLTLATRRVSARDVRKMGIDIMPADDYTVMIVQDTGGGIPDEHLNKIFEPFFTTKEQGKGTGLGLSTVYGIVKQSNGFIFADNVQGPDGTPIGARFTVYLPVHKGELPAIMRADEPEEQKASEWSAGGKLLLVEDEDMVRAVAERALVRAGYTVTTASDGEEGLGIVANGDTQFDLIVSDVVMPAMDGPAMARAIRNVRAHVPILFMSGYAEEQLRNEIDIENMYFIPKPFSVQQINAKVAEVLSAQRK